MSGRVSAGGCKEGVAVAGGRRIARESAAVNFASQKAICSPPTTNTTFNARLHRVSTCQSLPPHSLLSPPSLISTTTRHRQSPTTTTLRRQYALQQHPNCSFQGDHRHRLLAAYVLLSLSALERPSWSYNQKKFHHHPQTTYLTNR